MDNYDEHVFQSLSTTLDQLQGICDSIPYLEQISSNSSSPPILDLSEDRNNDLEIRRHHYGSIQGLKVLRDNAQRDQEVLQKVGFITV